MPKTVVILLLAYCCCTLCARDIIAIRSVETSGSTNRIDVTLTDIRGVTVSRMPDAKGVRITIPDVKALEASPQYLRTSKFIDRITAHLEGSAAVIDVTTMERVNYTYNPGSPTLSVNLTASTGTPADTDLPPAGTDNAPAGTVRGSNLEPQPAERDLVPPVQKDAEIAKPDIKSNTQDTSAAGMVAGKQETPTTQKRSTKKTWIWFLVAIVALLVAQQLIRTFLTRKRDAATQELQRKLEGTTLLFDSDTRKRMVQKLYEQGWSAHEITRELKISLREVETALPSKPE